MISIIVPVYNTERYLCECVESIIAQTQTDWELILIDDGSTDSSPQICDRYAAGDARIKALHFDNGGMSVARNRGLDVMKGDHVTFVDSDDKIHPRFLELLLAANADIACCDFTQKGFSDRAGASKAIYSNPAQTLLKAVYQTGINMSVWSKLYRRQIFDNIRFTPGLYYEDLDIFPRIAESCNGDWAYVPDKLYFYRKTPGSIMNRWHDKRLDVLKITKGIEEKYHAEPAMHAAAVSRRFSANYNMMLIGLYKGRRDIVAGCYEYIRTHRRQILADPNVRAKNKLGAILSYGGLGLLRIAGSIALDKDSIR